MIIFRPFWRRLAVWSALLLCPLAGAEPAPAGRDAVQARYRAAQQLARTGDPAQALRELIWCFDEGMTAVASFRGVRLSFLIRDFAQLAKRYPPAEDFMRQRCGEAELRMLGGEADGTMNQQMRPQPRDAIQNAFFAENAGAGEGDVDAFLNSMEQQNASRQSHHDQHIML